MIVYAGWSTVSAIDQSTVDQGLYAAPLCDGRLTGAPPCAQSFKLFGWTGDGGLGPVAADTQGNVFAAPSVGAGNASDAIYALSSAQALSTTTVVPTTLRESPTSGLSLLAALYPTAGTSGWLVASDQGDTNVVVGIDYTVAGGVVVKGTNVLPAAITKGPGADALEALFSDPDGNLWIGVHAPFERVYLELRRK